MKRVVVKDYDLFMDAVLTLFERPLKWSILKRLINKMIVQKDKIWDLCELLDRHRPFLRKGMCDTFPTNPSKHDAEGYTVQTGEQHLLNHQLLQKLETITTTFWRKGPAPKKRVSKPAKRSKSYLQQAKITPRAHGPRKLIPPEAFCDLSESDDPGYETIEDEDEEGGEDEKDEDEEGEDEEGEDEEGEDEVIAEEEE